MTLKDGDIEKSDEIIIQSTFEVLDSEASKALQAGDEFKLNNIRNAIQSLKKIYPKIYLRTFSGVIE